MKNRILRLLYLLAATGSALLMMGGAGQTGSAQMTSSQTASGATGTVRSHATGTLSSSMTHTVKSAATATGKNGMTGIEKSKHVTLSPYAEEVARIINFDRQVLVMVKEATQEHIHRLIGYDENGYQIIAHGIAVPVPEDKAEDIMASLRRKLLPLRYMVFIVEMNAGLKTDTIGILKGTDQYEILRVMQTNGDDYDISNQDIIDRLKEWEKCCAFDIIGAENDWVELEFKTLPKDLDAFAEEVYEFSPDAVDQGWGSVDGLIKEIKKTNRLFLWWD
jgi:hypothetical protein